MSENAKIVVTRLEESEERLAALVELQGQMKEGIRIWRKLPNAVPIGDSICHLIETVTWNEDLDRAFE